MGVQAGGHWQGSGRSSGRAIESQIGGAGERVGNLAGARPRIYWIHVVDSLDNVLEHLPYTSNDGDVVTISGMISLLSSLRQGRSIPAH